MSKAAETLNPSHADIFAAPFITPALNGVAGTPLTVIDCAHVAVPPHPSVAVHVIVEVPAPNVAPAKLDVDTAVTGPEEVNVNTGVPMVHPGSAVQDAFGINPALFK